MSTEKENNVLSDEDLENASGGSEYGSSDLPFYQYLKLTSCANCGDPLPAGSTIPICTKCRKILGDSVPGPGTFTPPPGTGRL